MNRALLVAAGAAALGALGLAVGFVADPRRTLFAYLAVFGFTLSTAVGALVLVMVARAVRARWFVALRRLAEAPMATLPLFLPLAIPILLGVETLYPWAGSLDGFPEEERRLLAKKAAWLSAPFFSVRCLVYLGVFAALGTLLARGSLAQDRAAGPGAAAAIDRRLQALAAGGLPVVGLALTFASFDLWMSLEPTWFSTVYGVYVFAGGFVAALALVAILAAALRARLPPEVAASHHHALGKLLLSFVIFWAYIAFVQLLIVWLADLPREIGFYLRRTEGSWAAVTWALGLSQFAVPFALLLSREVKRRPGRLAAVAVLVLAAHRLDFEWLVLPVHDRAGYRPHFTDLAALLAQGGVLALAGLLRFRGRATVAVADPALAASLEYRTPSGRKAAPTQNQFARSALARRPGPGLRRPGRRDTSEREHPRVRLAADTLPGKRIAAVGLAVIGFGAVLVGLAALILAAARGGRAEERPAPDPAPERLVGLLQTPLPGDAGLRTRAEGAAWLERWSWVDRERGLVRLPIDLAIARLLAGEVPAGVPVPTAPEVPPAPPPGPDAGVDPRGNLGRERGGREDGP